MGRNQRKQSKSSAAAASCGMMMPMMMPPVAPSRESSSSDDEQAKAPQMDPRSAELKDGVAIPAPRKEAYHEVCYHTEAAGQSQSGQSCVFAGQII